MVHSLRTAGLALVASLAVGCVGSLDDGGVGRMTGTLGEVSFSGAPELREARLDRRKLRLDLRILSPNGAAMVGIEIPHEGLDGDSIEFRTEDAEIIGCSGEEDGEWDFDCEPQDFFVDVFEGKDNLAVDFEGTWTGECRDLPDDAPDQPVDIYVDVDLI